MRIPFEEVEKKVETETEQSVSGAPTYHEGEYEWKSRSNGLHGFTPSEPPYVETHGIYLGHNIRNVSPTSGTSGDCSFFISFGSGAIQITVSSNTPHARFDINYTFEELVPTEGSYEGVTRTIDLGDDKFVTAVSVVSQSPSSATVTPTKTEHGASVYLYQESTSTITATIKLEYYYYETVKEAKVKFNGVAYKHIKFNGQVVV